MSPAWGAFHLTGIFGNFGENSNGTVHPGGMFSEKRKNTCRGIPFSRFYLCTITFDYSLVASLPGGETTSN